MGASWASPLNLQAQVNLKSSGNGVFLEIVEFQAILTIGQVARRSGVAASALRYYEERGLVQSIRSGAGHRRYPRGVLRRIAFIVFAQKIGLTLDEIAELFGKLPRGEAPDRRAWSLVGRTWEARIDERIAELER